MEKVELVKGSIKYAEFIALKRAIHVIKMGG